MAKKIHEECAKGWKLSTRVPLYASMIYDQIVYLDRANGSDAQDGSDWDNAIKTINKGCDLFYGGSRDKARGRHFAIVFRGRLTSGNKWLTQQIIDIPGVHLIGAGQLYGDAGGWDSCYVTDSTLLDANARFSGLPASVTRAGLQIQADDVMISGLKFYSSDKTVAHFGLGILDYDSTAGSDNAGRNCLVIDNVFQGDWESGAVHCHGVGLNGTESTTVFGNRFYGCEYAIAMGGGGQRYADSCIIEKNKIFSPRYGIHVANTSATDNLILDNIVIVKQTYGWTIVYGIDAGSGAGNLFARNIVGHATEGTAFNYGTGNLWVDNYHSGGGGTKANPDA